MKFSMINIKLLTLSLLIHCFSNGQTHHELNAEYSLFIYNDLQDTIELSEIGAIDYAYCFLRNDTLESSTYSRFPDFPIIQREPKDSISTFFEFSFNTMKCDSLGIIDSIQLDHEGSKEVIFYRRFSGTSRHEAASSTSSDQFELEKIEIWNLDTKKILFERITNYQKDYSNNSIGFNGHTTGEIAFALTFEIDPLGIITISDDKGLSWKSIHYDAFYDYSLFTPAKDKGGYREDDQIYLVCPELKLLRYEYINGEYRIVE